MKGRIEPEKDNSSGFPTNVSKAELRSAQIAQLYSQVSTGMIAAIVAACALAALLWNSVPRERLLLWTAVFLVVQIPRQLLLQRFHRKQPQGLEALPWGNLFLAGSGITALFFGMSAVFLFPHHSFVHQCILATFLGGFAASTAVAHAPLKECYVSSVLLTLLPLLGRFLYQGSESGFALAAVGLVFAGALLGTGNSLHRMIASSIRLRFQRDETIRKLQDAREVLEDRVAERTADLASKNHELLAEIGERQRTEEALRLERTRFQALAENLPLGLVSISEQGNFQYVNRKFRDLFGYELEDIPDGRRWFRWAYPDPEYRHQVTASWIEDLSETKPGERRSREYVVNCKDGSSKTILFRPVQLRTGDHLMTCEDVTERRVAEAVLREHISMMDAILDKAADGICVCHNIDEFPFVRFTHWNPRMTEITGYSMDEINESGWYQTLYPDAGVRQAAVDRMARMRLGHDIRAEEWVIATKDGTEKPLSISTSVIKQEDGRVDVLAIIQDVTERKVAEDRLRKSERQYRMLAENISDVIWTMDLNLNLTYISPSVERMHGWNCQDWLSFSPGDYLTPSSLELVAMTLREELAFHVSGKGDPARVAVLEVEQYRKDGTTFWTEITARFLYGDGQTPVAIIGTTRDITDRKKSEEQLRLAWETSPDALSISRLADGAYVAINQGYTFLTGYMRDEVIGRSALDLAFWADVRDRQLFVAHLKQHGQVRNFETKIRRKGGEIRSILISAGVMTLDGESHLFAVTKDVEEIKRAEEALRNSEATLRTLLQAAPIGIGQVSADRTLGWTNELLRKMLGYSPEELAGQSARILYESDEEFLRVGREKHPEVIRHGTGSLETRFRRKDGSVFPVLLSSSSIVREDLSQGIVFTAIDITERKRAEAQIRLNEERLQSLWDISQFKVETVQDLLDFTLSEAVKLAESKVGYIYLYDEEKKLFELNTWSKEVMKECEVTEPQTRYELDKTGVWGEAVRQRKPIVLNDFHAPNDLKKGYPEGHVALHNFLTIPVFEGDKIVAVVGMANKDSDYDESDVRQLTLLMDSVWRIAAAKRSELLQRRAATALEHAAEGVIITDTDGTIQYVNSSLERMTGYSQDELLGNNPRILKSGEQDRAFYEKLWRTIKGGGIWMGRFVNKRKGGNLYTEDATISPVRDGSGTITGFVGMKRDITEHLALSRQLGHAQKMEAVGTLAGGMAHDFNNILQAILGYSDLMLMKRGRGDPDRKKLEVIQQAARDGAELVSRILTFSRKAESKRRPVDLNEEIRKAQRLLRRTIPRMIDIQLVLAENLQIIEADPGQIEQILLNLGVNAHHAMPNGGQLLLETGNVSLSDKYLRSHLGAKAGRYVLLSVSDTGKGIDTEFLERIFEPFFTTKPSGQGTGLGLSMVHGIVSQHGGYIRCYSEPGRGTCFKIYLPVSERELDSDLALTREMPAFGTETILLVDDDDRIRAMGKQMIEMGGYNVLTAKSGEEALDIHSLHKEKIELVILDLNMPGMGGQKCLEELLRIDPDIRVLVASGYSSNGHAGEQVSSGAKGFVSKPYDSKDILTAIRRVLDLGGL